MKHFRVVFTLGVIAAALFTAGAAQARATKVEICHWSADEGVFQVISVAQSSVDKHFALHGDVTPGTYWYDADGDGYGDPLAPTDRCPNVGFVDNNLDCDDGAATTSPDGDDVCDAVDNDCDGVIDQTCCVSILHHCDANSSVLETFCGPGPHVIEGFTRANSSYVVLGEGVVGAVVTQCGTGATMSLEQDTNLCALPGGCCGSGRWNDEICSISLY